MKILSKCSRINRRKTLGNIYAQIPQEVVANSPEKKIKKSTSAEVYCKFVGGQDFF